MIWHIYSKGFVHVTHRTRHTSGITFFLLRILSNLIVMVRFRDKYYSSLIPFVNFILDIKTMFFWRVIGKLYNIDFKISRQLSVSIYAWIRNSHGDGTRLTIILPPTPLSLSLSRPQIVFSVGEPSSLPAPPSRLNPTYPKSVRGKFQLQFAIS